jgi:GMP synthase-like glutamine amidotransferase
LRLKESLNAGVGLENTITKDKKKMQYRVAVLDLNNNVPNQGLSAIKKLLSYFGNKLEYTVFDVRGRNEMPGLDFDIYISSGGPGDPREGNGIWEVKFSNLLEGIWEENKRNPRSKFLFLICHSFQLACLHFGVGEVIPRKSESFGTFPVHKTPAGKDDILLYGLEDPFYVADFRRFQVVRPDYQDMNKRGFKILAIEKFRPHIELERALMAIRFSNEIIGVQFHPEANSQGMLYHFTTDNVQAEIIDVYGKSKLNQMLEDLEDLTKIEKTHRTILPGFIHRAMQYLSQERSVLI